MSCLASNTVRRAGDVPYGDGRQNPREVVADFGVPAQRNDVVPLGRVPPRLVARGVDGRAVATGCGHDPCAELVVFWSGLPVQNQAAAVPARPVAPICRQTMLAIFQQAKLLGDGGQRIPVPYFACDDAVGMHGCGRTFGLEVEFDFPRSVPRHQARQQLDQLALALYWAGLSAYPHTARKGFTRDRYSAGLGDGVLERDPTVAGEWVSPILTDRKEVWEMLPKVLAAIRSHGGIVSDRTGGHIHVGVGDCRENLATVTNILALAVKHEDVLFRLGSRPGIDTGANWRRSGRMQKVRRVVSRLLPLLRDHEAHERLRNLHFRQPNALPKRPPDRIADVAAAQGSRRVAVNFKSVAGRSADHVEFRIPDASLDPGVIQAQVALYLHIVEAALRLAQDGTGLPLLRRNGLGHGFTALPAGGVPQDGQAETAALVSMTDDLFTSGTEQARTAVLFAATSWQPPANASQKRPDRLKIRQAVGPKQS